VNQPTVTPPVIIKAFGAASVALNGSTSLTFTIQNNNATSSLSGIGFTDNFPAGLTVASPNGLTGSCGGGTITSTAGSGVVSLSGATIASNSSCTFSVNVTGTTAGVKNNTTGNVTSTEAGAGGTASASLTVLAPPIIIKAFGAASIALNASTSLTFTIQNNNSSALNEIGFTDTMPAGLVISTPNGLTGSCGGGTITSTAGSGTVSLSGATIAGNSSCTFSVNVTGTTAGTKNNTTGNVTSINGGTGGTASASLSVSSTPPVIIKSFGAASIPLNGTTSLTFTIQNNNASTSLSGIGFTDNFPAGLSITTPNGLTGSCGGGTIAATAGSALVSLTGATLAGNSSCTFSVNVTGTTAGIKNNTTGNVTSTEGGAGGTASASLTVLTPPVIIKAFGAGNIPLNGSTSLTFTIQNNNSSADFTGVSFTDTMPAGLVISTPNGLTGSCGGGTITATAGSGSVALTGASVSASSSCTFSIKVTGTTAGTKNNTTGNVTSTNGGTGGTASASVVVASPPTIAKAFGASTIPLNSSTSLTFTITNPNSSGLTGVSFTDTMPAGLVIATPNALVNNCGGTPTAAAGGNSVVLTGGTVALNSSCTISVNVTGTTAGVQNNVTGTISSTEGGTGGTASASVTVGQITQTITFTPPASPITFGAAPIALSATGGASGNPIIFSVVSGPGSVAGSTLTVAGAGTIVVAANQAGNTTYSAATQVTQTVVVNKATPAATLTSSSNPVLAQNAVTLTATVSSTAGVPTGSVSFLDGTTSLGTSAVTGGVATLSVSTLSSGSHSITAVYSGDANFNTATSAVLTQSVTDFTFTIPTANVTAPPNTTVNLNFTVTPVNSSTFPAPITFSISGLPTGATYTFTPSTLPAGSGTSVITLTIPLPKAQALLHQERNLGKLAPIALALLLLPFGVRLRKSAKRLRRLTALLIWIAAGITATATLTGCGAPFGYFGQPQQTYNVTVTATSGTLSHNSTVQLTVE